MFTIPIPTFTKLPPQPQFQDLVNKINMLVGELQNLMLNVDSVNMFEVGGWRVTQDQLASKDGDVGMSTEDTVADDVRFWAGSTTPASAPWNVTESGKMTATGALIQSASSYPRVVMDPNNQLFGAYKDADDYIEIDADYVGSPVINVFENGTLRGQISSLSLDFRLAATTDLKLIANDDVDVTPGSGKYLRVGTFAKIYGTTEGKDLLTALGEKVNTTTAFSTYGVNMTFDAGTRNLKLFAGDGTQIAIVNIP